MNNPKPHVLPNFLIVGAQKCGTTSQSYYLREHPDIFMASQEVKFFNINKNWRKGLDFYSTFFTGVQGETMIGEKSASYSFSKQNLRPPVQERITSVLPDAKLIWCLRNPVDRAYSQHWFRVSFGVERNSFEHVLERQMNGTERKRDNYLDRGIYVQQIRSF